MISSGSKITVDRDNDKNRCAKSPKPLCHLATSRKTSFILQKYVEVDEAEPEEPLIGTSNASVDSGDTEVTAEHMTEEELLRGIEGLALVPREEPEEEPREEDANLRY
jgi:DNA-directed RNA polymerase subunit omega